MTRTMQRARALAGTVAAALFALAASDAYARPITLAEALGHVEDNAPLLTAAQASVRAAQARARQAGVSPNPELDAEVENAFGTGRYSRFGGTELTVAIAQRFERGGKRHARMALARADLELASISLLRTRADIVRDIGNAFADLVAAEQKLALAQETIVRSEELARTARLMVENGRDPPLRQFRAESALAEARADAQRARSEEEQASRALARLIGTPEDDLDAVGGEGPPLPDTATASGVPLTLRIAEAERRLAEARIALERSAGVSDITARAGLRGLAETKDVALVGGITMPLAIRDRNRGGVEAAQAELLAAEARMAQARLDSERETRDARSLLSAAQARLSALEGAGLTQAQEAIRVAQIGYGAGKFSLLDVFDAQASLTSTRTSIIEARRDRARALAALERALAQ
ncbi:TolC family protein [Sphingosinicella sp. BN140058]|uniref:TolC family protein n=1 Tax=Sphingosinicella sp. BN140058 TaxID=1892855 RepID=UPI001012817F|nr:TolC family protein [Sphingosinicella sp. BN140058]QAY75317.1 TolC family protein [Sphingosinicella sp. BN140058]